MPKRKNCKEKFGFIRNMPPLYNTLPGEDFEIEKSEVVQWLIKQPKVLQLILNDAKNSGHIEYNSNTGKWQGVDYEN